MDVGYPLFQGMPLPELADKYDCAIGTVRRAIEYLQITGELQGRQGKGTYVTGKLPPE
ncbi:hypothetical protein Vqi01_30600 [Micromonospora qiuiae]|uniref:GntR family transcriptional regulator n=1 Tax=Micromonospora qiuiae TaxID=502268 RepID=A0ABQ4JCK2_9ACTN|nr:hypothetical protein Vqi01_30600 [Micromonospora qiuiae]